MLLQLACAFTIFSTFAPVVVADGSSAVRVFSATAMRTAMGKAAACYEARGGRVIVDFASSGGVLDAASSRKADVIVVGHTSFMDAAQRSDFILADTRRTVAFLVPVIVVPSGNPRGIRSIDDLRKDGVRLALGDPGSTCLGATTKELLERIPHAEAIMARVVETTNSCEATARAVADGRVDASIAWRVLPDWFRGKVEQVRIADAGGLVGHAEAAVTKSASAAATEFVNFLVSEEGKRCIREAGFPTSEEEAARLPNEADFQRRW